MCFKLQKEWKIVGEERRESMRLSQSEKARTHDKAKQLKINIKKRGTERERAREREEERGEKERKRKTEREQLNTKKKVVFDTIVCYTCLDADENSTSPTRHTCYRPSGKWTTQKITNYRNIPPTQ